MLRVLLLVCVISYLSGCEKDEEDGFYIEANINGQHWRGSSTGDFLAINGNDNSKMLILIAPIADGSYNFYTNNISAGTFILPNLIRMVGIQPGAYDSKLQVKWVTESETNIARFELQRSTNTSTFTTIGSVTGQGTSTTRKEYQITDSVFTNLLPTAEELVYYRIKIIKTDNSFYYTSSFEADYLEGSAQIIYLKNGRLYYARDNGQNQITFTSINSTNIGEKKGSFSFSFKDETGNIVNVTDGKFHLSY